MLLAKIEDNAVVAGKIIAVHKLFALRAGNIANRNVAIRNLRPFAEIGKRCRPLIAIETYFFERLGVGPNAVAPLAFIKRDLIDR